MKFDTTQYAILTQKLSNLKTSLCICLDATDYEKSTLQPSINGFWLSYIIDDETKTLNIPSKIISECIESSSSLPFIEWKREIDKDKRITSTSKRLSCAIDTLMMNGISLEMIEKAMKLTLTKRDAYFSSILSNK